MEFMETLKQNPNAEIKLYGLLTDGSPINVIICDNKIICPIAMNIFYDNTGQKCTRFIPLSD